MRHVLTLIVLACALAACGAPPQSGQFARQEAALLSAVAPDDAAVRTALADQVDAWDTLLDLVQRREPFGTAVGADFVDLVRQTTALAQRQKELIAQGQDDPALNRQTLEQLRKLWADVQKYLGE